MSRSFTDLFGGAPHARVLDYLVEESDLDHTITQITRGSDVARPTVYKVVDDFRDNEIVVKTRTVGNSRFFQLNLENKVVQDLLHVAKPAEFEAFEVGEVTSPSPQPSDQTAQSNPSANKR